MKEEEKYQNQHNFNPFVEIMGLKSISIKDLPPLFSQVPHTSDITLGLEQCNTRKPHSPLRRLRLLSSAYVLSAEISWLVPACLGRYVPLKVFPFFNERSTRSVNIITHSSILSLKLAIFSVFGGSNITTNGHNFIKSWQTMCQPLQKFFASIAPEAQNCEMRQVISYAP